MTACLSPIHIRDSVSGEVRIVPCSRCDACLVRQRQEWTYRLREELRHNPNAFFVTLTYDNENLPIQEFVDDSGAIFYDAVHDKTDIQLFNKRLRHKLEKYDAKCRFYIVSEYGPNTQRPHYHGIYFLDKDITLDDFDSLVRASWPSPNITVDIVTDSRIKYVTEYVFTRKDVPSHLPDNFRLVSRNPGLGSCYIERLKDWHLKDPENRVFAPDYEGNHCNLPRYYRDKIFPKSFLQERAKKLEAEKFEEEKRLFESPDFDSRKYYRDKWEFVKDYHNKVTKSFKKHKNKQL